MIRCHILVEGQTEEAFVNKLLLPVLMASEVHVTPVLLTTKRLRAGGKYGGGVSSWAQIEGDLRRLLADTGAFVTTMLDYYGLPTDVPGMRDRPAGPAVARVEHVEQQLSRALDSPRFIPHIVLHEFEAFLFADPAACAEVAGLPPLVDRLSAIRKECGGAEGVDDGPDSAPSKRILRLWPEYRKTADGPTIAERAGLPVLRAECPHFDRWLGRVEALADTPRS